MAASVLKIGISRNPNWDNFIDFPKSGHIAMCMLMHLPMLLHVYAFEGDALNLVRIRT